MKRYEIVLLALSIPVFLLGSAWHFLFEWLGEPYILAWLMPVNESVWEHTKLGWIPLLLAFAVLAWKFPGIARKKWLTAALLAQGTAIMAMLSGHYLFIGALGMESMVWDISLYFVAVFLALLLAKHALRHQLQWPKGLCWTLLSAEAAMFVLLTYCPPDWPLFIPA